MNRLLLILLVIFFGVLPSHAQDNDSPQSAQCTLEIEIAGAIGVASHDYIQSGIARAKDRDCSSVLLLINTPGGSLQSTRLIVEDILASPVPVLCLIYPGGAQAGSAGAIIMQSCHVNGGIRTTNIGAATPVLGGGQDLAEDMRNKVINDTVSWLESIVKLRGRNLEFARDIVTEAKAVDSEEAARIGGLDVVVTNKEEFLSFAEGRTVELDGNKQASVEVGPLEIHTKGWRFRILDLVGDPQFAYLLFMGSLALLYFEITNPGTLVAGVLGSMGLILSLIVFHKLEIWWGGMILMLLGISLMIAEAFFTSFGVLAIGGMIAFAVGSVLLFDMETMGYTLPLNLVIPVTLVLGGIFLGLSYMVLKTLRMKTKSGPSGMLGQRAKVVSLEPSSQRRGQVEVLGETWRFQSEDDVYIGDQVIVKEVQSLTLLVQGQSKSDF